MDRVPMFVSQQQSGGTAIVAENSVFVSGVVELHQVLQAEGLTVHVGIVVVHGTAWE